MARIRSLKPEAFQSETLANVSLEAERTFLGLSTQADDRGRFRWQPKTLNGILWSERGNHSAGEFELELKELLREDALCTYVGCDGKTYGHLVAWDSHQRVDKPSPARIPPCLKHLTGDHAKDRCPFHESSCPAPGVLRESSGSPPGICDLPGEPAAHSATRSDSGSPRETVANTPGALAVDLGSRILDQDLGSRTGEHTRAANPAAGAAAIVGAYVEGAKDAGQPEPASSLRARVGKQAKAMLASNDLDTLVKAGRNMGANGWHDLAVQIQRDAASARGQPGTSGYKPYTNPADQSVYDQPLEAS